MSYLTYQSQHNLSSPPGQGRGPHFAGFPDFGFFFDLGLMAGNRAELFFSVVGGKEDVAVGEAWDTIRNVGHFGHVPRINQTFDGVGRGR
jgi:hypothetical protein